MARIELQHAEYFARMTALEWVRYWTRVLTTGFPIDGTCHQRYTHHDGEWN